MIMITINRVITLNFLDTEHTPYNLNLINQRKCQQPDMAVKTNFATR